MKKSKVVLMVLCAVALITVSVLGTLAYLTSQDVVVNTFTLGKVNITLDETAVNTEGTPIANADRVKENKYHLVPGNTYVKDPTMTVVKGSEESYVRMLLTINCSKEFDDIFAPEVVDLTSIFNGYDANNWIYAETTRNETANTVTYEFRYKETVKPSVDNDIVLEPLFDSITVPGEFDSDDMASISNLKITVVGHAIQKLGFNSADAAWTAFNDQISN